MTKATDDARFYAAVRVQLRRITLALLTRTADALEARPPADIPGEVVPPRATRPATPRRQLPRKGRPS